MIYPIPTHNGTALNYRERLVELLSGDLDFHDHSSREYTHDLHAFPARFPPQLPRKFIDGLTQKGERVLDPMAGSGTTILEAYIAERQALGFDIDPIAIQSISVKTCHLLDNQITETGYRVLERAKTHLQNGGVDPGILPDFEPQTRKFIDYWFDPAACDELLALLGEIRTVEERAIRRFLELVFSAIIITKSGGVSLALDLAHTRPHKVPDKPYRSPLVEFEKRLKRNLQSLRALPPGNPHPVLSFGNAQALPLPDNSIDLIVTSPPYPANAIDYMRAHKFSLVWLGYPIDDLSKKRGEYIGGEKITGFAFEKLPAKTEGVIRQIGAKDEKKALILRRYYSEMTRVLREIYRVLKPDKAAVMVVGSSNLRGIDAQVPVCLEEIGPELGLEIPSIGIRYIDRDRRMLPVHHRRDNASQIENRMHEEHVIGFYKPDERNHWLNS